MENKQPNSACKIKAVIGFCGTVIFFVASVVISVQARQHQLNDQPMPNGKGGFMSFGDGYLIAVVLFLFSAIWFVFTVKSWRGK